MWNLAINDKLTCELTARKGLLKENSLNGNWNGFLEHILPKHKGYTLNSGIIIFFERDEAHDIN